MFGVYAVAVRVSLLNDVTSGLMGLSRQFGVVHGNAQQLQRTLDRIRLTAMGGLGLAAVGGAGLYFLSKTLPAAREYTHQLAQMNVAGMKHAEIQAAIRAGWGTTAALPTHSVSKNLGDIRELRSVLGTTQEAINALPTMVRLQGVLSTVKGVTDAKGVAYEVAKTLDLRGASLDPARFQSEANAMVKALIMSGGTLGPADFFGTVKYGRMAAQGWDQEFLYEIAPTLIQAMKASGGSGGGGAGGPGNALMTAFSTVVGGKIAQKNLGNWMQLGLLDPSKIIRTTTGATKGVERGGVVGSDLFMRNPFAWVQQVLTPALQKAGVTTKQDQLAFVSRLFGTRTEAQVMGMMVTNPQMFTRDQGLIRGASGLEAYEKLLKTDPLLAQQALAAQWENIMTRIGIVVMPAVLDATLALMTALNGLQQMMGRHPTAVKILVVALAGLSIAAVVVGGLLMLGAAIGAFGLLFGAAGAGGVVATGLGLLGAAIAAIGWPVTLAVAAALALAFAIREVAKHWDTSKGVFENLKLILGGFFSWLIQKVTTLGGLLPGAVAKPEADGGTTIMTPEGPVYMPPGSLKGGRRPSSVTGAPAAGQSPVVPSGGALQKSSMQGSVYLDGRRVGDVVWAHQNRDLERASRQTAQGFDPGLALAPAAGGYRV